MRNQKREEKLMKKFAILFVLILTMLSLAAQSMDWQWVSSHGNWDYDVANDVVVDHLGNIYATGAFNATVQFGSTELPSAGGSDIFVTKHDSSGNLLWAVRGGDSSDDSGTGIAVDSNGNVFIQGTYRNSTIIGSTSLSGYGGTDIFAAKLNSDGEWLWAIGAGSNYWDTAATIDVDSSGNAYVVGEAGPNSAFGSLTMTSNGYYDIYVAKISSDGAWLWVSNAGGANWDYGRDIAVASNGDIYVTGSGFLTVTAGTFTFTANHYDVFVGKLNPAGEWLSVARSSGAAPEYAEALTIAADGSVYVSGYFYTQMGSSIFGTHSPGIYGVQTIFLAKLSGGGWSWVRSAGGIGTYSQDNKGFALDTDSEGNVYMTGIFDYTATFNELQIPTNGSIDIFLTSLDSSGNWRWVNSVGSSGADMGISIAVASVDEIYHCGYFRNTCQFGEISAESNGDRDIFIAKYGIGEPAAAKAPENLNIEQLGNDVLLTWDPVIADTDDNPINPSGYNIYYHDRPNGDFIYLGQSTINQFTHLNAHTEDRSFYKVTAITD